MHQTPRAPPHSSSSPATSPQTNPTRTNNQRDPGSPGAHSRPSSRASTRDGPLTARVVAGARTDGRGPTKDSIKKLDQIIQVCLPPSAPLCRGRYRLQSAECGLRTGSLDRAEPESNHRVFLERLCEGQYTHSSGTHASNSYPRQ